MNPVLMVSYYYPPNPAVGGVRPSRFAASLPHFGWRPIVLTTRAQGAARRTASAGGEVHRVSEWPHPLKVYERWQERRAARQARAVSRAAQIEVPFDQCFMPPQGLGLKRGVLAMLSLPDRDAAWLPPAVAAGAQLIRAKRIRHLVTTGPPFTCHLVGLLLKRLTGVAWIADFRDPWSLAHKFPIFRCGLSDAVETRLIHAVMRHADLVLSVTATMTDEARKEHTDVPVERFQTLTSGFDPAEFEPLRWTRPVPDPVVISYFGTFYHGRTPQPFLAALAGLLKAGRLRAEEVRVRFVGQVRRADGQPVAAMIERLGLTSIVTLHDPVPRTEALTRTLESHVVLVLDERHPVQIPLKLYDALAAGPVILNIGSHGAVADVVTRTGRGLVTHYQRTEEVEEKLLAAVRRAREAPSGPRPWRDPIIAEFDFRRLTERLAHYLEQVRP